MKKQLNEKQKLLLYRYGYHSFYILLFEIVIVTLIYASIEPSDGLYNLLYSIEIPDLLFTIMPLPIGYYAIRRLLIDFDYAKQICYQSPFLTILFLLNPNGMVCKIPILIILLFSFIVSIYQLIRNKKMYK